MLELNLLDEISERVFWLDAVVRSATQRDCKYLMFLHNGWHLFMSEQVYQIVACHSPSQEGSIIRKQPDQGLWQIFLELGSPDIENPAAIIRPEYDLLVWDRFAGAGLERKIAHANASSFGSLPECKGLFPYVPLEFFAEILENEFE